MIASLLDLLTSSSLFGLTLTFGVYLPAVCLTKHPPSPLLSPVLISVITIAALLLLLDIPLERYSSGASIITLLLTPTTALLAYSIYNQLPLLKKYFLPIVAGCLVGSASSMASIYLMARALGLSDELVFTMVPKSVTTPIAMEVSAQLGGIPSVTVAAVVLTGILGAVLAPILIKLFRIKNSIAAGVGIGCSSHAGGTSKAMEIGEVEGAVSGASIGIAGIITVLITAVVLPFLR